MSASRKRITSGTMRAKVWPLLQDCVSDGLRYGWNRAHKHTYTPDEAAILEAQEQAVMNEIAEWFDMDDLANG